MKNKLFGIIVKSLLTGAGIGAAAFGLIAGAFALWIEEGNKE